jgi:antirestriction protein ArdC
MKVDIYQRITDQIVCELEKGARPWLKPWNAEHAAGERGSLVVYANKIVRTELDTATGEEAERAIPFLKGYSVFNVEQIDGLPEPYYAKPAPRVDTVERIERAESFFAGTRAALRHGGTMACYNVSQDFVTMPPFEAFRDSESYYATLAHEVTHNAEIGIMPHDDP